MFGTTGEGASLGLNERNRALGALVGAGVDPAKQLVIGIAAASVEDAIAQGRAGLMLGCPSFLLAPPFYFKNPGDEGLFDWLAAVLTGLGPKASNVILYHIPQVTSVGLSVALIDRLKKAFPNQVKGVKDSSGSWENTQALLEHHGDLHILIGDERLLAKGMNLGASGTICGLANIAPDLMQRAGERHRGAAGRRHDRGRAALRGDGCGEGAGRPSPQRPAGLEPDARAAALAQRGRVPQDLRRSRRHPRQARGLEVVAVFRTASLSSLMNPSEPEARGPEEHERQ